MRPGEVERWVVKVVDQVERRRRVEDDRVECKRQLIDPAKAARRIAGHANEVREDRILWIVGIDEKAPEPIVGVDSGGPDLAEWWAQVEARFDSLVPSLTMVNVHLAEDKMLLGLGFDTSSPPYVLKVSSGEVGREVPWREGTRTRSANRIDLLKLLVPLAKRPQVAVLDGSLELVGERHDHREGEPDYLAWHGQTNLYVDCQEPIVFPDHRCSGRVELESGFEVDLEVSPGASNANLSGRSGFAPPPSALMAEQGANQVVVYGSSPIWLRIRGKSNIDDAGRAVNEGRLHVVMQTAGLDPSTITLEADLVPKPSDELGPARLAQWTIRPSG